MLVIPLILCSLVASSSWKPPSPAPHDPARWSLDTGCGPRWTVMADGWLVWECETTGTGDSLLLPRPSGLGDEACDVEIAVVTEGPMGAASSQVVVTTPHGGGRVVEGHAAPGRVLEPSWVSGPGRVDDRFTLPAHAQVMLRVRAGHLSLGAARVRFLPMLACRQAERVPMAPASIVGSDERGGPPVWRLAHVRGVRWRQVRGPFVLPQAAVARIVCPFTPPEPRWKPRVWWRLDDEPWDEAPCEVLPGNPDTLVTFVVPAGEAGERLLTVALECEEGGCTIGPVRVEHRGRSPGPRDLRFVRVVCAPTEAEFVEVESLLDWPLQLHSLAVGVDGRTFRRVDGVIGPRGSLVLTRDTWPGLALPNRCACLTLTWDDHEVDRLCYGPPSPAPAPPPGWALRADSAFVLECSPGTGVAQRLAPPSADSVMVSELFLWPRESPERFIELTNHGHEAVALGGWALVCEDALVLPDSIELGPGEATALGAPWFPRSFALNPDHGEVALVDRTGRIVDLVRWGSLPDPGMALVRSSRAGTADSWLARPPTPGVRGATIPGLVDIEVTRTPEGRYLQWDYRADGGVVFVVYRARTSKAQERERIATVLGSDAPPFGFVDISARPEEDYLYWLGIARSGGEEILAGPFPSEGRGVRLELEIGPPNPNPFRAETILPYSVTGLEEVLPVLDGLPRGRWMTVAVYTMNGALLRTLASGPVREGRATVVWDGRDARGRLCPPDVYVVSLQVGPFVRSSRVVFAGQ